MKRIIIFTIIGALLISVRLTAQDEAKTKSDDLLAEFSYHEAIERLESNTQKSTETYRKLAFSYNQIADYQKAEQYYVLVVNSSEYTPEDVIRYAEVLKINKKYAEAEKWYETYNRLDSSDTRAILNVNKKGYYKYLLDDKGQFQITNLYMNTRQQDFGACFYKDQIVFASTNHKQKLFHREWNWNKLPFLDLQLATADQNNQFSEIISFDDKVNKKYHEGPASFNEAGDFMVFTRNNYDGMSDDNRVKLQLFSAEVSDGVRGKLQALPFNSSEYSVGHPSLTADGSTLYFASDMPGGIGGTDIYVCHYQDDGSWSNPVNLGKPVNTEGNEMFPFIHKDGILFFASNGFPGLGGLDVFAVQIESEKPVGEPKNLAVPVNSSYDDFALILNGEQSGGYFSSNRPEGKGDDDIYYFQMLKPIDFEEQYTPQNEEIIADNTDNPDEVEDNTHALVNPGDQPDDINLEKQNPVTDNTTTQPDNNDGQQNPVLNNTTDNPANNQTNVVNRNTNKPEFSLYCLIRDKKTMQAINGATVILKDNFTGKTQTYTTPASGDFREALKGLELNARISYDLTIKKAGYLSKTLNYSRVLTRPGQYDIHEILDCSLDKINVGDDLGKTLNINPIYFDYDKSNIRPDAAAELDKIVKVMNENPDMVIELGSHTDCRGTKAYNIALSSRRAKSSAAYIKKRITHPERIFGRGYGESKLVNQCADGAVCTEEEHQMNRRTEFRIIKM